MTHATHTPRRVAFVLGQARPGGTELQSAVLIRGLRRRGVEVDVYVVEGGEAHLDFGDAPVTTLDTTRRRGLGDPVGLARAAARLGAALRHGRYDVVHAALARAYVIAPVAAPVRNRPRIVAWRRNLSTHLRDRTGLAGVDCLAARLCDAIVTNSQTVREHWVSRGHVPAGRTRVIHNALEPWRFDRPLRRVPETDALRMVTVGGLRPVKGHQVLLDAAAMLHGESIPAEVVIVGDGTERDRLCAQADRLGVPLVLPGHVPDPRHWLGPASVYVHPSRSEGASNAVAEAMAQGCAIVATNVGGTAEILGSTGILVRPDHPAELAAAIRALHLDPELRADLGDRARTRARALFDLDRVIDDHLDVYAGN